MEFFSVSLLSLGWVIHLGLTWKVKMKRRDDDLDFDRINAVVLTWLCPEFRICNLEWPIPYLSSGLLLETLYDELFYMSSCSRDIHTEANGAKKRSSQHAQMNNKQERCRDKIVGAHVHARKTRPCVEGQRRECWDNDCRLFRMNVRRADINSKGTALLVPITPG
ncbi:hypothetical protein PCH_Pc22g14680 [Penicillium rubens Wisconsin 54-1255]|uniref:Uncharacterized protein n=1 Tax=Penicillium rubens (strain ATCC 28089 / DSM 1075 / NRRL 1951 / Wisconsin 54-1255) TaxID=500485 RepID=B6HV05_PENRW|nr:hypothetical protein PCH_Pc22g14680 [Penicillium rubens Wisconsin 54-1255]